MPDYRKVTTGQDIVVKASTWNSFLEAASDNKKRKQVGAGDNLSNSRSTSIVKVINDSGSDMNRWEAVAVTGVVSVPNSSDDTDVSTLEFFNNMVLEVDTPSSGDEGKWLVLLQPLADQEIGLAVGIGVTQAKINIVNVADTNVDIIDGSSIPNSGVSGPDILWVAGGVGTATDTGNQLAVIRLGGGGSSSDDELEGLVTASTLRSGELAAWFYTVVEGVYTPDGSMIPLAGGRTITGVINRCEVTNDSSGEGELSQGVTVDDISDTPLKPIRNGCGVLCRKGQSCSGAGSGSGSGSGIPSGSQWAFSTANAKAECTP